MFQSVLPAYDACVAMWTAGSGQHINVYQLRSWDRRQGDFLGVGISTRTHPRHGQSSQLRLVSVLGVPSLQLYGDSVFVRYRVDEIVGVHVCLFLVLFFRFKSPKVLLYDVNKPLGLFNYVAYVLKLTWTRLVA